MAPVSVTIHKLTTFVTCSIANSVMTKPVWPKAKVSKFNIKATPSEIKVNTVVDGHVGTLNIKEKEHIILINRVYSVLINVIFRGTCTQCQVSSISPTL